MLQSVNGIGERIGLATFLYGKRAWQRVNPAMRPKAHEQCLFVAGVQRSGTNLLMEVLERCLETDVYHETDPRAFDRYQLREEMVLRRLVEHSPAPVVVVKCLMESQRVTALLDSFRPARAIWVVRRYQDVVNSMHKSFSNQAAQVTRVAQGSHEWLSENMTAETLAVVQDLASRPLDDISAAAVQWYFRNRLYFDLALDRDPRIMLLHYEDLVTNPDASLPRIEAFAGVRCGPRARRIISANSVGRRAPPSIRADVEARCAELYARLQAHRPGQPGVPPHA